MLAVTLVDMPSGGTRKRCKYVNIDKYIMEERCILRIQNNDDICCARAIVTGKANIDQDSRWNIFVKVATYKSS